MHYLANSKGQDLVKHLLGVALRSEQLMLEFNPSSEKEVLTEAAYLAGLFHDIGKVDSEFQSYIQKRFKQNEHNETDETDAESERRASTKNAKNKWHEVNHQVLSYYGLLKFANDKKPLASTLKDFFVDIINYSVYWHHPEKDTVTYEKVQERIGNNDVFSRIETILGVLKQKSKYGFTVNEKEVKHNVPSPSFMPENTTRLTMFQPFATLVTQILIESDREVSSWTVEQLDSYLESNGDVVPDKVDVSINFDEIKKGESVRDKEQYAIASKTAATKFSFVGVDPGGGKTRIGLMWRSLLKNKGPLFIALPKRRQVDSMFESVKSDLQSLGIKATIQAVHSGSIQHHNHETDPEFLGSDINIVVFDQMFKGHYKRREIMNYIKMLNSPVIFDEYHEFMEIPNMLPCLRVFLNMRNLGNNETLFLSGTPNQVFNKFLMEGVLSRNQIHVARNEMSPVHENKALYTYRPGLMDNVVPDNTLCAFNKVAEAQEFFINDGIKDIVHSAYCSDDMSKKAEMLITNHGKNNNSTKSICTGPILNSSFDISFKNLFMVFGLPERTTQFFGRRDRHGDKPGGVVNLYPQETPASVFAKDRAGGLEIYKKFNAYLSNEFSEGKELTLREAAILVYDNFLSREDVQKQYEELIKEKLKDGIKNMNHQKPSGKTSGKMNQANGSGFRGLSRYVYCKEYDNAGNFVEPSVSRVVSISKAYMFTDLQHVADKVRLGQTDDFGFQTKTKVTKYNKFMHGLQPETPYYMSHWDENVEKERIVPQLSDSGFKELVYYNETVGMVSESIWNKLKTKLAKSKNVW